MISFDRRTPRSTWLQGWFASSTYEEYHYVRSTHTVEHRLLRKVMVLNTTRLSVIEPSLCADGEVGYVKELFKYFGYSDEQVTTGHRSFFGLRWPFTRVSSGRV